MLSLVCSLLFVAASASPFTCFGKEPEYDAACAKLATQVACQQQVACLWGDKQATTCFPKDDPQLKDACAKFQNETLCDAQIGCAWRSDSDLSKWVSATNAAVQGLQASAAALPFSVALGTPSATAMHDHQSVTSADLAGVLHAWQTKYGLPAQAVTAMSALVAAESVDFKSTHAVIKGGAGQLQTIAIAGRNWNSYVSVAFVYGAVSAKVITYPMDSTCMSVLTQKGSCPGGAGIFGKLCVCKAKTSQKCTSSKDCHVPLSRAMSAAEVTAVDSHLQAILFPKLSAEGTLLEADLKHMMDMGLTEALVI